MRNILLIEPNTLLRQTYAQALSTAGYKVQAAPGAQQAIHAADIQTPGVVVLELQLIGHNGIEFLHEFRSYAEWQHIPVIINTSIPAEHLADSLGGLKELGVVAVLYKPRTSLQVLLRHVREQLSAAP